MKKTSCALMLVALLSLSTAAMALPKVTLSEGCEAAAAIDAEAAQLIGLISMVASSLNLPPYEQVDLELAAAGDGIPDYFQLGLLSAALCSGDSALNTQFQTNKDLYNQLLAKLTQTVGILLGPKGTVEPFYANNVGARLHEVSVIIGAHTEIPGSAEVAAQLEEYSVTVLGLLADASDYLGLIDYVLQQLAGYSDIVAGLVGLNSEMQATVTGLLAQYAADIEAVLADAGSQIAAVQQAAALLPAEEAATVNALATDATTLLGVINWVLALPDQLVIFGSAKTGTEAFSAAGDYDGDGVTNLVAYNGTKAAGRVAFVEAASGYNPFWSGNPGLPAVGLVGLAMLSGVVALGGALSIRRK